MHNLYLGHLVFEFLLRIHLDNFVLFDYLLTQIIQNDEIIFENER